MEKEQQLYKTDDLVLAYGRYEKPTGSKRNLHLHQRYCEILCIHQCKGNFHVEGSSYAVKPGDMIIMQPNESHYMEVDPSVPYDRTVIRFYDSLFDSMDPARTLLRPFFQRQVGKRNLYRSDKFNRFHWSQDVKNMREDPSRQNILFKLIKILELLNEQYDKPYQELQEDPVEYRIMQYIKEHIHENISTKVLCDHFFISRTQLHQRCINATGMSVGKYIATLRMITAQQLIQHGNKATEIYTQCGFQDYSTFYRAYKKHFGHSPSEAKPR